MLFAPLMIRLTLADFDYALPTELIAQTPLPQRSASRLLVVDGERCTDSSFVDLPLLLRAGDLLVMNDSRVLHARLLGNKESGGQIEILVERLLDPLLAAADGSTAISYAHDGERSQYLCAAIRTGILPSLPIFLDEGHRAVRHWYARHRCAVVDFSDQADCFANVNHPDQQL